MEAGGERWRTTLHRPHLAVPEFWSSIWTPSGVEVYRLEEDRYDLSLLFTRGEPPDSPHALDLSLTVDDLLELVKD